MTRPRSHGESESNPGLCLPAWGSFQNTACPASPKSFCPVCIHPTNPTLRSTAPLQRPTQKALPRAQERYLFKAALWTRLFTAAPKPPALQQTRTSSPRSLTHLPVSGSPFPAVSLPGRGSPRLDGQGRDEFAVEMQQKKRKIPNTAVSGRVSFQPLFSCLFLKVHFIPHLSPAAAEQPWGSGLGFLQGPGAPSPRER